MIFSFFEINIDLNNPGGMKMKYKRLEGKFKGWIEIDPEGIPVDSVLEEIAKTAYSTARMEPGLGGVLGMTIASEFEPKNFITDKGLDMEWVYGKNVATIVNVNKNGKLYFNARYYENDRREKPENLLDIVKGSLESKFNQNRRRKEPPYWSKVKVYANQYNIKIDPNNARESRLKVALALDKEGKVEEAISIMMGSDFDPEGQSGLLLLLYTAKKEEGTLSVKKFYEGFSDIDKK